MKSSIRCFLCALALGVMTLDANAGPIEVSLSPSTQTVNLGTSFQLDVGISGLGNGVAPSLGAFDLALGFDPLQFSVTGVQFATGLGDPNTNPEEAFPMVDDSVAGLLILLNTSVLEANANDCVFCVPPYLDDIQTDAFPLLTLTLRAIRTGDGAFTLEITGLSDADGDDLIGESNGATVKVLPSAAPIPGTLLLLLLGLAGLGLPQRLVRWSERRCEPHPAQ